MYITKWPAICNEVLPLTWMSSPVQSWFLHRLWSESAIILSLSLTFLSPALCINSRQRIWVNQQATKLKALYLRPVVCSCRYSTAHEMNVSLYLPSSSTRSSTVYEYILISTRDPQVPWIYVLCCSGFTESAPQSTPNGTITGKAVQTIALAIFQPETRRGI